MSEKPTCIVHIDAMGNSHHLICGEVSLLVIDERAPYDRVFEVKATITREMLAELIGDDPIGSKDDERHPAVSVRVLAEMNGERRFKVVSEEGKA